MQDIKELGLKELEDKLLSWGRPKYHAKQILAWIFQKGAYEFSSMSDLPAALRDTLGSEFYMLGLGLADLQKSSDGTAKFLFELNDGNLIEAVNIPMTKRAPGSIGGAGTRRCAAPGLIGEAGTRRCAAPGLIGEAGTRRCAAPGLIGRLCAATGCISSQAGCKFACEFCASALKGFKRNLTSGEILDEVLYLRNNLEDAQLTHIVFMGTGEPLDNYENVLKAVRIINSVDAFNIGARRITISTCGIIPGIKRLQDEDLQVELSVSLHTADDKLRSKIMPVNQPYPLADLIKCCHEYIEKTNRQITFEYILVKGLNSDSSAAQKLVTLLKNLRLAKVNLIPANPVPGSKIIPPSGPEVLLFKDHLFKSGLNVTLRRKRGQDIDAACGQLRLKYEQD
jgi:23S rRNA (adenine2503-C2)-methyltransferase